MPNPGLSEIKTTTEDNRMARRQKAVAGVKKLQAKASGSDAFEGSSGQVAPSSVPAWKGYK